LDFALAMAGGSSVVKALEEFPLRWAHENSIKTMECPVLLGPMDHVTQTLLPITVVLVYRHEDLASEELIPVQRLRKALERLLDYYPHLTGRVVMNRSDQTPHIERLGSGGILVSAECSEPLESFEKVQEDDEPGSPPRLVVTDLPDGGNALLPPFDPTDAGMTRNPILIMQHTRFRCGGVSIGICLRHIFCDGVGFFQLVRDLAHLYRGITDGSSCVELTKPPHIRSYMAELHDMEPEERQEALTFQPTNYKLSPEVQHAKGIPAAASAPFASPPPVIGRVLCFSSSELVALKTEANAGDQSGSVSTFCALSAHIWQSIFRSRVRLNEERGMPLKEAAAQVSRQMLITVDLRSRNQLPDAPPQYFPNAVNCPAISLSAEQLLHAPLPTIAALIRDGAKPQDQAEVQKALRWITAQSDKRRVQPNYEYAQDGVIVTQSSKFDMYRSAILEVLPALIAQPFTPQSLYDGLAYFMATEEQLKRSAGSCGITSGSIDVTLALSEPIWGILDRETHFRRHRQDLLRK